MPVVMPVFPHRPEASLLLIDESYESDVYRTDNGNLNVPTSAQMGFF